MSIVRLAMAISHLHSPDVLWNASRVTPFTYVWTTITVCFLWFTNAFRIIEMNLGIMCSCMMFTPSFIRKGRIAARSMKSLLGSGYRTDDSLSKVRSPSGADHVIRQTINDNAEVKMEAWEHNIPNLELLTDRDLKHSKQTKHPVWSRYPRKQNLWVDGSPSIGYWN